MSRVSAVTIGASPSLLATTTALSFFLRPKKDLMLPLRTAPLLPEPPLLVLLSLAAFANPLLALLPKPTAPAPIPSRLWSESSSFLRVKLKEDERGSGNFFIVVIVRVLWSGVPIQRPTKRQQSKSKKHE